MGPLQFPPFRRSHRLLPLLPAPGKRCLGALPPALAALAARTCIHPALQALELPLAQLLHIGAVPSRQWQRRRRLPARRGAVGRIWRLG